MFDNVDNKPEYVAYFLSKVIKTIVDDYYYDVTNEELYHAAIKGMTNILDDYSVYIPNKNEEEKINQNICESANIFQNKDQVNKTVFDHFFYELGNFYGAHSHKNVKLIKITEIQECTVRELKETIRRLHKEHISKIIVDLRDNVGGNTDYAVEICNLLVSMRTLFISYDKKKSCVVYKSNLINKPFEEIIVLTNSKTASAAEAVALSLRDDGNIIIGQKTYGKGVAQKKYYIYGGAVLNLTVREFFTASGNSINNEGVYPDIVVECSNEDSIDKILERAYSYIGE